MNKKSIEERLTALEAKVDAYRNVAYAAKYKWHPDDIEPGVVAENHTGTKCLILISNWTATFNEIDRKFMLGGLGGNPLRPFSTFHKNGGVSKEGMADHFNKLGYKLIGHLETNFKDIKA
jgi:hypothetical protein